MTTAHVLDCMTTLPPSLYLDLTRVGSVFYFLLVGLVSLLTQPKDKTVVGAGLVSPAAEEAVSTRGTTSPGQPRATTDTSAKTALARIRHCLRRALVRRRYK